MASPPPDRLWAGTGNPDQQWIAAEDQRDWAPVEYVRADILGEVASEQPEKWSFETLMYAAQKLLDTHYPPDVFVGVDGPGSDPGVRLIVALRDCIAAHPTPRAKEAGHEGH